MESRQDLTKELLAGCFKELMLSRPFEKITIKNITDKAGLIRPTYYKHFQDKYEVLEWIFINEIGDEAELLIENDQFMDALLLILRRFEKDAVFYRKAFKIPGPNGFRDVLEQYLTRIFERELEQAADPDLFQGYATKARTARYLMHGLISLLEDWLFDPNACSPDEFCRCYRFLANDLRAHDKPNI
ncbi:MAG: TetR/AcrR family transcriptional regulator C-terminal domain-containing protein [Lachnospiraceae bacterium]|nr:TetR/AcrR family transcriptional regulator C-terminal domain-containing protein [Lachnospiraceae bacterium]